MASNIKNLTSNTPSLFTPSVMRSIRDPSNGSVSFNLASPLANTFTSIDSTSSFKYGLTEQGLRSTQQLNIDWSNFANHTFFNSAQVKLNVAFDKIQNQFPFDGTQKETEIYLDTLTGYEKYVFDNYPKHKGYLFFSGTQGDPYPYGTWIETRDQAGASYSSVSRDTSGNSIINPKLNPMTIEYWIYIPTIANDDQVILDKHNGSLGFMSSLNTTISITTAYNTFYIASGSSAEQLQVEFNKGEWNHIAWILNKTPGYDGISAYLNGKYYASSSMSVEFDIIDDYSTMYIGSGSAFPIVGFTPANTLSGALDELRIWHTVRTSDEILTYINKPVFANDNLKLYYKFNEPSGSNSPIVIDASSNSLHGKLNSYLSPGPVLQNVRQISTSSITVPMIYEDEQLSPVLFGNHVDVSAYRSLHTLSASLYDEQNPNIITKLVPKHYFTEGQVDGALENEFGEIGNDYSAGDDPRSTKLGPTQTFLLLLYTWAKFFDEMKLYTQAFADLNFVDYNQTDTVPDQFLQQLARSQGIELPMLFTGATAKQFISGDNINDTPGRNSLSLQSIQNQIWRRILINLRDVVTSKGTIYGVKSFIRSIGIDPDNNFRIREYGGPTSKALGFSRDKKNEIATLLDFGGGGLVTSPYLSGTRIEPGYPEISNTSNDGLFTSGSWTYEGLYKWPLNYTVDQCESLVRFVTTGSITGVSGCIVSNLIANSSSNTVTLYARPNMNSSPYLKLSLTGANIFDGDKWNISFGRQRNDSIDSIVSSSYFLRVAKNSYGDILEYYSTSSFFNEHSGSADIAWETISSTLNASGSFFTIGSGSVDTSVLNCLNDSVTPNEARETNFIGQVAQIRFWSKALGVVEWKEHVRNFKSIGVQDPLTNFNFVTNKSSSFERLRIDASTIQEVTDSNGSGNINIFDYSQNNLHLSGTDFLPLDKVILSERYFYSYISPKFDQGGTVEKVRIRSFEDYNNVAETPWAQVAPVYEIPRFEEPTDDTRFTIDFSTVDALDRDIVNILSTLDELDNILGNPELLFASDYPGLASLREVYFNRLDNKINLRDFFNFFKWFDTNIGTFVQQLIPKKTKFNGTNFIIESHMLERPKFKYIYEDQYLGDTNRGTLNSIFHYE
jgi:hypothetical protein